MLEYKFVPCGNQSCIDEQGLRNLIKNVKRLRGHINILESQIEKMNEAYCGNH
jgi:hypothetical protein